MGSLEDETMSPVVNRLETAQSVLEEARLKSATVSAETVVEGEQFESSISKIGEKVEEIEEEVNKIRNLPKKSTDTTPSSKKRRRVPPTTDEEVYERWLETLEESSEEESKTSPAKSTSQSSSPERKKRRKVPPTTDKEVYERWLETLEE